MNKLLGILGVSLVCTASAFAQNESPAVSAKRPAKSFVRPYGMAGCGLGSVIFDGKGAGTQIFAATTNGSTWNNTSGITSGTSNCVSGPNVQVAAKLDRFLVANSSQVAEDLSRGNGEALKTVTGILGCNGSDSVNQELKAHFADIFVSHDMKTNEISDSIVSVVKSNESLKSSCSAVI